MGSIELLAADVVEKLRASLLVSSLAQGVVELVHNALDANATSIDVRVDVANFYIQVRDDGTGIRPEDLSLIAKRHATSKCHSLSSLYNVKTFGFRGEALHSLAEVSVLEILTRHSSCARTHIVVLKGNKVIIRSAATSDHLPKPGTIVTVRNLFYRYPVRRKQIESSDLELERIRRAVEGIALMAPHAAFAVVDVSKNSKFIAVHRVSSPLARFRHLFGAHLVKEVHPVCLVRPRITIKGFISLKGHHSRRHEYFYVNRRGVASHDLDRVMNRVFRKSRFAKLAGIPAGTSLIRRKDSPLRMLDKYPIYVLELECPSADYDMLLDTVKSQIEFRDWAAVRSAVVHVAAEFLLANRFITPSEERRLLGEEQAKSNSIQRCALDTATSQFAFPTESHQSRPATPRAHLICAFEMLSGVKSADRGRAFRPGDFDVGEHVFQKRENWEELLEDEVVAVDGNEYARWRDPWTKNMFFVDLRTGNSYEQLPGGRGAVSATENGTEAGSTSKRRRITLHPADGEEGWVSRLMSSDIFKNWKNPVFYNQDAPIPGVGPGTRSDFASKPQFVPSPFFPRMDPAEGSALGLSTRLSKRSLSTAQVIGQVDRKFIAVRLLPDRSGEQESNDAVDLLVLIDQHAADERVRVEAYLEALVSSPRPLPASGKADDALAASVVDAFALTDRLTIRLTRRECEALKRSRQRFGRWGLAFEFFLGERDSPYFEGGGSDIEEVVVTHVPKVVADRCAADSRLMRDLVRNYLEWLEEWTTPPSATATAAGDGWSSEVSIATCPKGILDILNSKACRGAIMFNDPLDLRQCRDLVSSLAACKSPFQCAHGRPSMLPLLAIASKHGTAKGKKRRVDLSRWKV